MKIAIEGCAHGELDVIYETISCLEQQENYKVDLLICCGDFQSSRNEEDLKCMAVPEKYCTMCSFYRYYSGEKKAPILTLFIGGNHEASNYLQELPYGGWVAPNIYYLGYAGVINVAGIRIGGISGIYKGHDYMKGHFECTPYDNNTKRSVYHIRSLEVFRLKQMSQPIDIFLSHDWPTGITEFGDRRQLIRFKPHFEEDIKTNKLGSKPCEELLHHFKPKYWFAAHLHCKFAALVSHSDERTTKFLALDKCLSKRRFLQIVDVPHESNLKIEISYDLEWLTILRLTNHLTSVKSTANYMPGSTGLERWQFTPSEEELSVTLAKLDENLTVPSNFVKTARVYSPGTRKNIRNVRPPRAVANPQTVALCNKLSIDDPLSLFVKLDVSNTIDSSSLIEESSCNNSTFIGETMNSLESPAIKRTSLLLPDPIKGTNTIEGEDLPQKNSTRLSLVLPPASNDGCQTQDLSTIDKDVHSKRKSADFDSDPLGSTTDQTEQKKDLSILDMSSTNDKNTQKSIKKLKRRNASIYENQDYS